MYSSILNTQNDLIQGKYSLPDLVEQYLKRIEANKHLNAFNQIYAESARLRANQIQIKIEQGVHGKMAGAILSHKDNLLKKGEICSASSHLLEQYKSPFTATVIERLEQEDAIFIGNNNSDEFAMGSSNETSAFGSVLNPINENYVPGGSSGGSAAAVAAGLCHVSLGTDTGGSVRQPAAYCGVKGFKPSFGTVSRHGLMSCGVSLDCIGPISKHVSDLKIVLDTMMGADKNDPLTLLPPTKHQERNRLAVFQNLMNDHMIDSEVHARMVEIIGAMEKLQIEVESVNYDFIERSVPTYSTIVCSEASNGLLKYYKNGEINGNKSERAQLLGHEVKRRIIAGQWVRVNENFDLRLKQAQKMRRLITDQFASVFSDFDFVILPTVPGTAFKFESDMSDPKEMYNKDVLTVPASLAGLSAITMPIGLHSNGMPMAMQILAPRYQDQKLLDFATKLETNILSSFK